MYTQNEDAWMSFIRILSEIFSRRTKEKWLHIPRFTVCALRENVPNVRTTETENLSCVLAIHRAELLNACSHVSLIPEEWKVNTLLILLKGTYESWHGNKERISCIIVAPRSEMNDFLRFFLTAVAERFCRVHFACARRETDSYCQRETSKSPG